MQQLLIDTTHEEETIALVVEDGKIIDMHHEMAGVKKGNIYVGSVFNIDIALESVFIFYGDKGTKPGFLPLGQIDDIYFKGRSRNVKNIDPSTLFLVQIEKEERFNKGAYLTTHIALLGRYCILMPNPKQIVNGVSKKIQNKQERERLQQSAQRLDIPKGFGIIWRTAVENAKYIDLKRDYKGLIKLWHTIESRFNKIRKPCLIHEEAKGVVKILRDHFNCSQQVKLLNKEDYKIAHKFLTLFFGTKYSTQTALMKAKDLEYFQGHIFNNYVNKLIERKIVLKSGASIQITHTEALISVDVNSGKAKQNAWETNLEAVKEAVRQIYLKKLHGIIVIDLIDMDNQTQHKEVEQNIKDAMKMDKARLKISKINELGLLELSRQRIAPSVFDWLLITCKYCASTASAISVAFIGRMILRNAYHRLMYDKADHITLTISEEVGKWIVNEKVDFIQKLKMDFNIKMKIIINEHFKNQDYKIDIV